MIVAAERGHVDVVRLLVDRGANVEGKNQSGVTALLAAAQLKHVGVVRTLLDAGADVTVRTRNRLSLLSAALDNADRELLRLYVDLAY